MKISHYILIFGGIAIVFLPLAYFVGVTAYFSALGLLAGAVVFLVLTAYLYWRLVVKK